MCHPDDHPEAFVARKWIIRGEPIPTNETLEAETLEELREKLSEGLCRIPRSPGDDPIIVESWL